MTIEISETASPLGGMTLAFHEGRLCGLGFSDRFARLDRALARRFATSARRPAPPGGEVAARLRDYFAGDLAAFEGLALELRGTPFQRAVWEALRTLPPGRTASYGEIARAIGRPHAVRAVGLANGANPVGLVVPCHRVIGADGSLTGYGGGLERKRWLLAHEARALEAGRHGAPAVPSRPARGRSGAAAFA